MSDAITVELMSNHPTIKKAVSFEIRPVEDIEAMIQESMERS